MNTTWDARGDGLYPDPAGEDFRALFAWHGKFNIFLQYDNLGAPIWEPHYSQADTSGRLGAPQFAGIAVLHADKSAVDKNDDALQPSMTNTYDSDIAVMSYNTSSNIRKMQDEYAFMSSGHDKRLLDKIGEKYDWTRKIPYPLLPVKSPFDFIGGPSSGMAFGPYDIDFGKSIHIVLVEAVAGISREKAIETGINYKKEYKSGKTETEKENATKIKNEIFYSGKDSLFQTFRRARANYNSGWALTKTVLPPSQFTVQTSGKKIRLAWTMSDQLSETCMGFRIYRLPQDNEKFEMIAALSSDARSYTDSCIAEGGTYRYYIQTVGPRVAANPALGIVEEYLISGKMLTLATAVAEGNTAVDNAPGKVCDFRLFGNYPNPFNPVTTIRYQIPLHAKVTLKVYNLLGQNVAELVNEYQSAGQHEVKFDASHLASGVYIYRLQAGNKEFSKKLALVK